MGMKKLYFEKLKYPATVMTRKVFLHLLLFQLHIFMEAAVVVNIGKRVNFVLALE